LIGGPESFNQSYKKELALLNHHKVLLWSIYCPSFILAVIQGLALLIAPLYALDQNASWLEAGALFALKNIGTLLSSLPGGIAIARFGERRCMWTGGILVAMSTIVIYCWKTFFGFSLGIILLGLGIGIWTLARQAYLSAYCKTHERGRVMSVVATVQRVGMFLGPLIGGFVSHYYGFTVTFGMCALFGVVSLIFLKRNRLTILNQGKQQTLQKIVGQLPDVFHRHKHVFLTAGIFAMSLRLVRVGRQLLLPLWGHYIGLSAAEIGFVVSLSVLIDSLFIYFGGEIADKYGRKWSGSLCLLLISTSFFLLPFSTGYYSFIWVALLAGIGNGLGGGIVMILGSDLAPVEQRGLFLGGWRLLGDVSAVASPLIIGSLGSLFSLGLASAFTGGLGLLGLAMLVFTVKETLIPAFRGGKQLSR